MAMQYQPVGVPVVSGNTSWKELLDGFEEYPARGRPKRALEAVRERDEEGGGTETDLRRAATPFNAD